MKADAEERYDAPDPWWFAWLLWPAGFAVAVGLSYFFPWGAAQ